MQIVKVSVKAVYSLRLPKDETYFITFVFVFVFVFVFDELCLSLTNKGGD